jgi:menaquinone-dependent protoporphyrinogen oxidase
VGRPALVAGGGGAHAEGTPKGVEQMNVLVVYASRFGSTRGIAACIAEKLGQEGTPAEARPVEAAGDLGGYDAFVVGSAVFAGHWMEEATEFVRRNRAVLASRPVWLFSSGPIGAMAKKYNTPAEPKGIAKLKRAVDARDHRVFFGAWDRGNLERGRLGFAERIIAKRFLPEGDWRDWPEIEAWATDIARSLAASRTVPR